MREKLIKLLGGDMCKDVYCCDCEREDNEKACVEHIKSKMADHLIANGVTIPVCCKDCKHFVDILPSSGGCQGWGGMTKPHPNGFCSYGERRTDG